MTIHDLDEFVAAYLECALWSSLDVTEDGSTDGNLDDRCDPDDFSPEARTSAVLDCRNFVEANATDLAEIDAAQAGHDFWLTRNGHGAGFWDRGLGEIGERLTDAARAYGEVNLWADEDNVIHDN